MQKKYSDIVKIRYPPSEKILIKILEENVPILTKKVPDIKKIILFGSYARQRPHFGSDVDLLIIVSKRSINDFEIIYETLYDLSLDYEWSPMILSEERLSYLNNIHKEFFQSILEEGIVIWSEK